MRYFFLFFFMTGCLLAKQPPNLIFILVDDWGWTDGGVFGSDLYQTPTMDQLAQEGIRFSTAYAASTVCSPTRAALMTGQYPARIRVTDWIDGHTRRFRNKPLLEPEWTQRLEHSTVTIAERLKEAGYRTASIGKWHLTPKANRVEDEEPYWPEHHGFGTNIAGNQHGGPGDYFAPFDQSGSRIFSNMPKAEEGAYLTDVLAREAVNWIEQVKGGPFFLYMPFYAVHTPIEGRQDLVEKYEGIVSSSRRHRNIEYAAMVESTDQAIGKILEALDNLGIRENTWIFITGDNGGLDRKDTGDPTDNFPLRNGKGSVYEGGVRVPGVVAGPGVCGGRVIDTPVITMDFYPTMLSLAGLELPSDSDGVDLKSALVTKEGVVPERDLFWHYPHYHAEGATPYTAVRSGFFRLIEYHLDENVELYNLETDPGETQDLSRELPHIVIQLRQKMDDWRKSVNAQFPTANPDYDPTKPTFWRW